MATKTVSQSDLKKVQREIIQLRKRIERLENKRKTETARKKKIGANGHRPRSATLYKQRKSKVRALREAGVTDPLEKFIGAVDLGYATGLDNEQIDRELANEYNSTHEPK